MRHSSSYCTTVGYLTGVEMSAAERKFVVEIEPAVVGAEFVK